ncbi:unnamed protein product [Sphagnum jensenii]|uniref:Uncharacterized protein n=1 Tax=Sphagnum jensenii TaxID=128206 RepID=A0ABP0WXA8_9BRYO
MAAGAKDCSNRNNCGFTSSAVQATAVTVAMAGRICRACDVCGMQRARWHCAADEAYLCQRCDASVHGANALARRHERSRLGPTTSMYNKTSSRSCKRRRKPTKTAVQTSLQEAPPPAAAHLQAHDLVQQHTLPLLLPSRKRSKRTRRPNPRHKNIHKEEEEEEAEEGGAHVQEFKDEFQHFAVPDGYMDSEIDFEETMGSLMGDQAAGSSFSGAEDHGFGKLELTGLSFSSEMVTLERRGDGNSERTMILEAATTTEGSATAGGGAAAGSPFVGVFPVKVKNEKSLAATDMSVENRSERIKEEVVEMLRCSLKGLSKEELGIPSLRLNYEDVLSAWSDQSFWTLEDGNHLQTVPDHNSTHFDHSGIMEMCLVPDMSNYCGNNNTQGLLTRSDGSSHHGGGEREARVLRYKEKRRTRLFCKTVRYEVRKLNAERRPRMKGRFVRRTPGCI